MIGHPIGLVECCPEAEQCIVCYRVPAVWHEWDEYRYLKDGRLRDALRTRASAQLRSNTAVCDDCLGYEVIAMGSGA